MFRCQYFRKARTHSLYNWLLLAKLALALVHKQHLQCTFSYLVPIICTHFHQIEIALTDPQCSKLMIIGCYRSDEVDETSSFSKTLRDLKNNPVSRLNILKNEEKKNEINDDSSNAVSSKKDGSDESTDDANNITPKGKNVASDAETSDGPIRFEITELLIGNLDVESTRLVIADLLQTDEEELQDLAEVCHEKTKGNVFFVISFLRMLKEIKLLKFNLGAYK